MKNQNLGLTRADLVSARLVCPELESLYETHDPFQQHMLGNVANIVNKVQLTKVTQGQMFGKTVKMQRLADMTLSQLEGFVAKMKSPANIDYGVSSVNQEDQEAMRKLGISAPQGAMDGEYPNGVGLYEKNSLERIMKVLQVAAHECANDPIAVNNRPTKNTKLGELASTYLNQTQAGILASESAKQQGVRETVADMRAKVDAGSFVAGPQAFRQGEVAGSNKMSSSSRVWNSNVAWFVGCAFGVVGIPITTVIRLRSGHTLEADSTKFGQGLMAFANVIADMVDWVKDKVFAGSSEERDVQQAGDPSPPVSAKDLGHGGSQTVVSGMTSQQTADARVRVQQRRERRDQNPARPGGGLGQKTAAMLEQTKPNNGPE